VAASRFPVSRFRLLVGAGNRYRRACHRGILDSESRVFVEARMKILVTAAGMLRLVVLCFVLGIVMGVYFGAAGSAEPAPPAVDHSVGTEAPVNAVAP
jgi:hypothetical protein